MANNIGIKVNVDFPTITQMRDDLTAKLNRAIDGMELHKVKVEVNQKSVQTMISKIKSMLAEGVYEIKVSTKDAMLNVDRLDKRIKEIDSDLKGVRKLRVNLDITNLNSQLKDLMSSMTKMQKDSSNALEKNMKGLTNELSDYEKKLSNVQKKQKFDGQGNLLSRTTGSTEKDEIGGKIKNTQTVSAKGVIDTVEQLWSKETALREIAKQMKVVDAISRDIEKHNKNGDSKMADETKKRYAEEKQQLKQLNELYKERYNSSSNTEGEIKALKNKLDYERKMISLQGEKTKSLEEERAVLKAIQEDDQRIAQAVKEMLALEQKRHGLMMKIKDAEGETKDVLKQKLSMYTKEQQAIMQSNSLLRDMTAEQKAMLSDVRQHNALEEKLKDAIKGQREEKARVAEMERATSDAVARVAQLEQKRFDILQKIRTATGGVKDALQQQYAYYGNIIGQIKQQADLQNRANSEQREALKQQSEVHALLNRINDEKQKAIALEARQKDAVARLKAELRDVLSLEQKIASLKNNMNRDGSFTDLKMLKQSLKYAKERYNETEKQLKAEGKIDQAVKDQVSAYRAVGNEQTKIIEGQKKQIEKQRQANNLYNEYKNNLQRIGQLQRDLAYAGQREASVITGMISDLQRKNALMQDELSTSKRITQERKDEVAQIERAQAEQKRLNQIRGEARELDKSYNTTGGVANFYSVYSNISQGFREVVREVAEFDEAYMKIKKVSESTDEALKEFKDTVFDTATSVGVSATEYMTSVEKWVTAGKSLEESSRLAKVTTIGSFVGNVGAEDMSKWLSVPLNAFGKDMLQANDIINVMNETSNNHAVEMVELGKAYMRSASSVTSAGVSFAELTGMITAAQEATRIGGERIGTSLKAISSNFNYIKAHPTGASLKKFDFFREQLGIDLSETESMTEAFEQLADVWSGLKDTDKNLATFYLAGKEHQNILTAIMNEWDTYEDAMGDAQIELGLGESGSAYREFEEQKDSVRFALAELKNAWAELMNTIGGDNGLVKDVLSGLSKSLNMIEKVLGNEQLFTALKFLVGAIAIRASSNGLIRIIDLMATGTNNILKNLSDTKNLLVGGSGLMARGVGAMFGRGGNGADGGNGNGNGGNGGNGGGANGGGANGGGSDADLLISGAGSNSNKKKKKKKKKKKRNRQNDSDADNDTREATDSIDEVAEETAENRNKAKSSARKVAQGATQVAKTALGFIPIVGELMLIAEFMGMDVFGSIGRGIDGLHESAEESLTELEAKYAKLEKDNALLNGDSKKMGRDLSSQQEKYKESLTDDRRLSAEDFIIVQEKFNNLSEEMGIEVKIKYNDADHIEEMQKLANEAYEEVNKQAGVKLAKESKKILKETEEGVAEAKEEREKLQTELDKKWKERKKDKDNIDDAEEKGVGFEAKKKGYEKDLAKTEKEIKAIEKEMSKLDKTSEGFAKVYENLGKGLANSGEHSRQIFEGMEENSVELTSAIASVTMAYEKQKSATDTAVERHEKLKDTTNLTKEGFQDIIDVVGEVDSSLSTMDFEAFIANEEGAKDAVMEVVKSLMEQETQNLTNAEIAYKVAMEFIANEKVKQSEVDASIEKYDELGDAIERNTPPTRNTTVSITKDSSFTAMENWVNTPLVKRVQVQAIGIEKLNTLKLPNNINPSVSTNTDNSISTTPKAQGLTSASVSTGSGFVSNATTAKKEDKKTTNATDSKATDKKATNSSNDEKVDNSKVSQDIWRYWKTEDNLEKLANSMSDLERAVTLAGEDYAKIGQKLVKQLSVLKSEESTLSTYKQAKTHEAIQQLDLLKAYGFNINKKDLSISNLETQSMKLTGEKATSAEELLNKWHSLVSEIGGLDQQIKDIAVTRQGIEEEIKANNIAKEMAVYEKFLSNVEKLLSNIEKKNALNETIISLIDEGDFELQMKAVEKSANDSRQNINDAMYDFNKLSKSNIVNKENAEEMLGVLESLADEMLNNADAVIEYTQSLKDMEIERLTSDIGKASEAFDDLNSKLDNNRTNVSEGLLSGTRLNDLQSSTLGILDLHRENKLDKMAKERIKLEESINNALEGFAVKNIDRTKKVANTTLEISKKMYTSLQTMATQYNDGKKVNFTAIVDELITSSSSKAKSDTYSYNKELEALHKELYRKQTILNEKYADGLSSENHEVRLKAEYGYLTESLEMQKDIDEQKIKASRSSIKQYQKELSDTTLTTAQKEGIQNSIKAEEDAIIEAQNNIKSAISEMYSFKFEKINEVFAEFDKMDSLLAYSQNVLSALKPNDLNAMWRVSESIKDNTLDRKQALRDTLATVRHELALHEKGSYQWNILNEQAHNYGEQLRSTNESLIEMNKNMANLRLDNVISSFETSLFGGKSLNKFNDYKDLWLKGLEKELALEELAEKIAEIGTNAFDEKMSLLDKQEKVSRLEMDYLSKQLEILAMQEDLEKSKEQRTVKTLQRNLDGTFDWNYVADKEDNSETSKNIKKAQLELLQMEDEAKESYLSKLNALSEDIQNNNYDSREDVENRLGELSEAYSLILGDIPASLKKMSGEVLYAYEQYALGNTELMNEIVNAPSQMPTIQTIDKFRSDVVSEIQKLGDKIQDAVMNSLNYSLTGSQYGQYDEVDARTAIPNVSIESVEFPNATSSDEIKNAILNLPKVALQYSKSK